MNCVDGNLPPVSSMDKGKINYVIPSDVRTVMFVSKLLYQYSQCSVGPLSYYPFNLNVHLTSKVLDNCLLWYIVFWQLITSVWFFSEEFNIGFLSSWFSIEHMLNKYLHSSVHVQFHTFCLILLGPRPFLKTLSSNNAFCASFGKQIDFLIFWPRKNIEMFRRQKKKQLDQKRSQKLNNTSHYFFFKFFKYINSDRNLNLNSVNKHSSLKAVSSFCSFLFVWCCFGFYKMCDGKVKNIWNP